MPHDCIITGNDPLIDPKEGRRDLEVCLAAYRSEREKRTITLPLHQ